MLQSNKFWGFGTTTCCLKSITCFQLSSNSNDAFASLQAQVLSMVRKVKSPHLKNIGFTWKTSAKGTTEKHPFKTVDF